MDHVLLLTQMRRCNVGILFDCGIAIEQGEQISGIVLLVPRLIVGTNTATEVAPSRCRSVTVSRFTLQTELNKWPHFNRSCSTFIFLNALLIMILRGRINKIRVQLTRMTFEDTSNFGMM